MKHKTWNILVVLIFVFDRVLKLYFQRLPDGTVFSFLPDLEFGYHLNPSLFFFPAWRFIPWVALMVLIGLVSWYGVGVAARRGVVSRFCKFYRITTITTPPHYTGRHTATHTPLLPILLGGLSNVYDRFAFGGVIDYVEILGFATINLADILILAGLVFLFDSMRHSADYSKNARGRRSMNHEL